MAKFIYKLNVTEYSSEFEGDFDLTVKKNGKEATWVNGDEEIGSKIVVEGDKLVRAEEGDHFESGKITGLTVFNSDEKILVDVSNLNLKAAKLSAVFLEDGLYAALNLITEGDDTVVGTKKADLLYSGAGDDTLTGKGGSDTFIFQAFVEEEVAKKSGELDTITDFDVKGDDKDYLQVDAAFDSIQKINKNHDVQINFDDGSALILEGVTKKQFQTYLDGLDT